MEQEQKLTADQIIKFLEERNFKELKEELENLHPVDLVDAMEELDKKQRMLVFRLLSKEEAAEVFTDMNSDMRESEAFRRQQILMKRGADCMSSLHSLMDC